MLKKTGLIGFLLLLILPISAFAQSGEEPPQVFRPEKIYHQPRGFLDVLLDQSRFSMSHSYSLSVFSMSGQTFNQGMYLNTMNLRISDPLMMQVRMGYMHQPLGGTGLNPQMNGKVFLQQAMLKYEPSENLRFTIDYQQLPSPMLSPYSTRW